MLALTGSSYEGTARGILYVIYEIMWKIIYYVLTLIDEITVLFYKVAGINVVDGVVENKNMLDQLLNQSIISTWYGFFTLIAAGLVVILSVFAILKAVALSEEKKSLGPIVKNIGLATLLLIVIGPILVLLLSMISNIGLLIARVGGNSSISIADIIFSNSGNLIQVYNETFASEISSFRDLGNDFLYDLMYNPKEGVASINFHWYIALTGGVYVLYNLVRIVIDIIKRIFNIVILYVASPVVISKMVLDDGKSFKEWQSKILYEFLLLFTQLGTFMIFIAFVNILNNIDFTGLASNNGNGNLDDTLFEPDMKPEVEVNPDEYSLLNGLGRTLIIMTSISVTRSSAEMLANLLSSKESKTESLLESLLNKLPSRSGAPITRTRTITRNTTTTKRETVFVENEPRGGFANNYVGGGSSNKNLNNNVINQNISVSNKFTNNTTNKIENRVVKDGVKLGNNRHGPINPGNIYINTTKTVETTPGVNSWKLMDTTATKAATSIAKEYTKANNNLTNAINSGDSTTLKKSLDEYTKAYSREAEMLNTNYRKFESRASASMKSEINQQTKEELKNISTAYKKAQMDYSRTANKLSQYRDERMSTAEALKMKEQADKQRERLMSASNKAAQFYENQKRGE